MKSAFAMLVAGVLLRSAVALASEGASVLLFPNGDVEIENVGAACAAPRTIVELSTNAVCQVVCQVYYRDNLNPLPTDIEEMNETDRVVNLLLATYMGGECWDMPPEELVDEYRNGDVFDRLAGFPEWLTMAVASLKDSDELAGFDVTVVAVSMKAVGEFSQLVSK